MSSLLLIDSRIADISGVIQGIMPSTDYIVFDFSTETYQSLRDKITKPYDCIGIAQHNFESIVFPFLDKEEQPILCSNIFTATSEQVGSETGNQLFSVQSIGPQSADGLEIVDPELSSWQTFIGFLQWLKEERGMQYLDLLLCNVWSDPNWVYAISTIKTRYGIHIRASLNITGEGGDFILESDNVDMIGIYFTNEILNYHYAFAYTYLQQIATASLNAGSGTAFSMTDNGYAYSIGNSKFGRSSDFGQTWTFNATLFSGYGYIAACSANGQIVVIGYSTVGEFKLSVDYGMSFTKITLPATYSNQHLLRGFLNPSGTRFVFTTNNNSDIVLAYITGTNVSFTQASTGNYPVAFKMSKDGNIVYYPTSSGTILYRHNLNTGVITTVSTNAYPLSVQAGDVNEDGSIYYWASGAANSYVNVSKYTATTNSLTLQYTTQYNDTLADAGYFMCSRDGQIMVFAGGSTNSTMKRFWYSTDGALTINAVTTNTINGIGSVSVTPDGLRFAAATNGSSIYIYTRVVTGSVPTIISGTGKFNAFTLDFMPSTGGYPAVSNYLYSTNGGTTFSNLASGPPSTITVPSVGPYSFVIRANGAGSWTADSAVYTVNVPCFLVGTLILRYNSNTQREEYVAVENIRKGDLIKTARNGYKAVHCIGSRDMYNPALSVKTENRIYCYKTGDNESDGLFTDLYVTGNHCALLYDVPAETLEKVREHMGDIYVTEGYYRVPACLDGRAAPISGESVVTIWHFALEHESRYKNYGVYANGLLVESSSIRYMEELSGMEMK